MTANVKYGWYVRSLIIKLFIIGFIGIIFSILSLLLQTILKRFFLILGISIIILFLWPAIGMIVLNIVIGNKLYLNKKLEAIVEIEEPYILDVGCGTGRTALKIAKVLKKGGIVYGIDIYDEAAISGNKLETIQNNAKLEGVEEQTIFKYGSATDIPFENEMFDIITVSSVLHEIHDNNEKKVALQEIFRVLKEGGYLYLCEWNRTSWQTIFYFGIFCFVFKTQEFWNRLLYKSGFKNISYENTGGFGIFHAVR